MDRFLSQLKTFHDALDPLRRKVLYGAVAVSVLAVGAVAWMATADVYVSVLEGDRRDRVQATAAQLEELEIPYRVIGGGTGLEVPEQFQGRAFRLSQDAATAPAAEDMPEAKGFMTPRDQDQRYKFLLQQRIAQNIAALRGINRARVELVLSDDSSFFAEETPARAAVVLELEPSVSFGNEQVRGVVALLRNSVDGLDGEQISIVDDSGSVLYEGPRGGGALDSQMMARKRSMESDLEGKVADHLIRRLGSTMDFTVTALVELTTESSTVEIREVDPESAVTISSQMSEEKTTQSRSGGVPGTASNLPEKQGSAAGSGGSSERLNEKVNYDVSETTRTIQNVPGAVKRQAVSVQVDQARLMKIMGQEAPKADPDAAEGEAAASVDPTWLAEQSKLLEESIRAAVFFNDERGDVLHVTVTTFSPLELVEAPSGFSVAEATPYVRYAVAALAVVLLFTTVLRPLVARVTDVKTPEDLEREAGEADEAAAAVVDADDDLAARLRDLVENYESVDADDLNRLVEREDEAAAQVIRLWNRQG